MVDMNENELAHYGVLGMKWGKRKALHKSRGKLLSKQAQNAKDRSAEASNMSFAERLKGRRANKKLVEAYDKNALKQYNKYLKRERKADKQQVKQNEAAIKKRQELKKKAAIGAAVGALVAVTYLSSKAAKQRAGTGKSFVFGTGGSGSGRKASSFTSKKLPDIIIDMKPQSNAGRSYVSGLLSGGSRVAGLLPSGR